MRHAALFSIFLLAGASLFGHVKDVTFTTINLNRESIDGEIFINGFQVAQLAQNYNLDPSQLSQESLKNLLRSYFDIHFEMRGSRGTLGKKVIDFRNSTPAEFLASGISLIFYVKLERADWPIVFASDMFFEFSTTQTNKLALRDKLGRPFPGSRDVLLTPKLKEFTCDWETMSFARYDLRPFDSDGEGIADQYEELYGLDPFRPDTDGDGFSDFEEFYMGWDPFDAAPASDQSRDKYQEAILEFAGQYRRKPTETSLLLSYVEESQLKEEGFEPGAETDSAAVQKVLAIHDLPSRASVESGFLAGILGKMEADLYMTFNWGGFFLLLLMAAGLGFLHTGASGPGKGILLAYCAKDNRAVKPAIFFALAFALAQLGAVCVELVLLRLFFAHLIRSLGLIVYLAQIAAGVFLVTAAVVFILGAVKRIRQGMVVARKSFFDGGGGAVLLGAATGLGAAPFLWSMFQMLLEIERAGLIPFFALLYGLGVFACLALTALAGLVVRHIVLDIIPKLVIYAQLVSASLMLVFALFFAFIRIPF